MADEVRKKARADVQRVQSKIERAEGQLEAVREERRESFERARAAGLSLATIDRRLRHTAARMSDAGVGSIDVGSPDATGDGSRSKDS
jgi:hypothetical protein